MMQQPIESQLRALGAVLDYPETPDISARISEVLEAPRPRLRVRLLAVAAAIVLVAIVVGLVPATRETVMSWLGVQGVRIERTDVSAAAEPLDVGAPLDIGEAAEILGFSLGVPEALEQPPVVFVSDGRASFVYPGPNGTAAIVLTQFRGDIEPVIFKQVPSETAMRLVSVDGNTGVWIEGPHTIFFAPPAGSIGEDDPRLAGNTLLWQRGEITYRLEGVQSLDEAIRIAESVE